MEAINPKMEVTSQMSTSESIERRTEEVAAFIEEHARGSNNELVRDYGKTLVHNIEGVDLTVKNSVSDAACGKHIAENITKILEFGGEPLIKVVANNIDITRMHRIRYAEIKEYHDKIDEIEEQIHECEKFEDPKREDYDLRAKIEIEQLQLSMNLDEDALELLTNKEFEPEGVKSRSKRAAEGKSEEDQVKFSDYKTKCRIIRLHWNTEFIKDQNEFKKQNSQLKDLRKIRDGLNAKIKSELVVQHIMRGIEMAILTICNKIKNAVKDRLKLKELLQSRIVFETTGEIMVNPYDKGNVPGMIGIIQRKFHRASFGVFTNELVDIMRMSYSSNISDTDPIKIGQAIDKIMGNWDSMNYWEYMTRDVFFTAILLRTLAPESATTTGAMLEVSRFINQRDKNMKSGELSNDEDSKSTPIYQHLMDYLSAISESMEMKRSSSKRIAKEESLNYNDQDNHKYTQSNQRHVRQYKNHGNAESAASAEFHDNKSFDKKVEVTHFDTQFRDSVTRDMNVTTVAKNGYRVQYTSTRKECEQCKDPNTQHKPKCYLGKCKKCNNYGHKFENCRQLPTSFTREKHQANMVSDVGHQCDQERT